LDSRASIACEEIASAAIMRPNNKGEHIVSSKQPSHRAFVVTEPKQGSDQKGRWYEVGVIWPHKSGKGFDLVVHPGISVSGRIVCTEPKSDNATE
jgi:type IV secretory pathway TraG/TraD family ATPase VirD4